MGPRRDFRRCRTSHSRISERSSRPISTSGSDRCRSRRSRASRGHRLAQILALYELLKRVSPGPMVTLNHAIAAAMVHGPAKGLELLKPLDTDARLADHYRLDAVRGHLLEMLGDHERAIHHYRIAAGRTTSLPEQNYLMTQAARLAEKKAQ